jgi:hypothetical protein
VSDYFEGIFNDLADINLWLLFFYWDNHWLLGGLYLLAIILLRASCEGWVIWEGIFVHSQYLLDVLSLFLDMFLLSQHFLGLFIQDNFLALDL